MSPTNVRKKTTAIQSQKKSKN